MGERLDGPSQKSTLRNAAKWAKYRRKKLPIKELLDWNRFWKKVEKTPTGCWLWIATAVHEFGYGRFFYGGKTIEAHVYAYTKCIGQIPKGKQIDHLCRMPACVNPAHLEAVTLAENVLRGQSPMAILARRTHCARGNHPLSGENLFINANGQRECRICRRELAQHRAARERRDFEPKGI